MAIAKGTKRVAENRKARHEYFIEDTYECGIALVGTEVKSIRAGKVNLKDSYAQVKNGECLPHRHRHVSPYEQGNIFESRSLPGAQAAAVTRARIRKLNALAQVEGYSLIPLQLYFKDGRVKLELAVAKGKKLYDKRSDIASRDARARGGAPHEGGALQIAGGRLIKRTECDIILIAGRYARTPCAIRGRKWFRRGSWRPDKRAEAPCFVKNGKT